MDKECMVGGMTMCEASTYIVTCGESARIITYERDNYVYTF